MPGTGRVCNSQSGTAQPTAASDASTDDPDILLQILLRQVVPGVVAHRPAQELRNGKDNYGPDHRLITRTLESYRERSP